MKEQPIITMAPVPRDANAAQARTILSKDGLNGSMLTIPPRGRLTAEQVAADHVLLVTRGGVEAEVNGITYLLGEDEALHVAHGRTFALENPGDTAAKLFRLEIPARVEVGEPLLVFPS